MLTKKFSILIITQNDNKYLQKCIRSILKQNHNHFEVILVSDEKLDNQLYNNHKIKLFVSSDKKPSFKRNLAIFNASFDWLVFLDDDSFITSDYLHKLDIDLNKYENDKQFIGFGGPGILPEDDNFFSKILDCFFGSFFATGAQDRYSIPKNNFYKIYDWLSANLVLRSSCFDNIIKFNEYFWPGEDTEILKKITSKGRYLLFNKNIFNYHYRRSSLNKHLKQIFRYGNFRGYLISEHLSMHNIRFYAASFHLPILTLSIFLIFFNYKIGFMYPIFYILICILYLIENIFYKNKKIIISLFSVPIFIVSHIFYNFGLLKGLLLGRPKLKLGR